MEVGTEAEPASQLRLSLRLLQLGVEEQSVEASCRLILLGALVMPTRTQVSTRDPTTCGCCSTEKVCAKCAVPRCRNRADTIKHKTKRADGRRLRRCLSHPASNRSDDESRPPLPNEHPRTVHCLPREFVDRVQQTPPDLFEHYDCETWNELQWHVETVHDHGHSDADLQATVRKAEDRGILYLLEQTYRSW